MLSNMLSNDPETFVYWADDEGYKIPSILDMFVKCIGVEYVG